MTRRVESADDYAARRYESLHYQRLHDHDIWDDGEEDFEGREEPSEPPRLIDEQTEIRCALADVKDWTKFLKSLNPDGDDDPV